MAQEAEGNSGRVPAGPFQEAAGLTAGPGIEAVEGSIVVVGVVG